MTSALDRNFSKQTTAATTKKPRPQIYEKKINIKCHQDTVDQIHEMPLCTVRMVLTEENKINADKDVENGEFSYTLVETQKLLHS